MAGKNEFQINVVCGPVLRTALDVLDLAIELAGELPVCHPGRNELLDRAIGLKQTAEAELKRKSPQ